MSNTKQAREETILNAFDWLQNVYGLDPNDALTAGDVEELLEHYNNTAVKKLISQTRKEVVGEFKYEITFELESYFLVEGFGENGKRMARTNNRIIKRVIKMVNSLNKGK